MAGDHRSKDPKQGAGGTAPASERAASDAARGAESTGKAKSAFLIVGIGASAGGLEAFSQVLEHLSPDTGMAFVFIQHLAVDTASMLPELLARKTSMPVMSVADGIKVLPDHVYVLATADDVVSARGHLKLVPRSQARGMHLPIDTFFRSLAGDQGRRAVGIVLSGAASDGTLGLQEIKAGGGITLAQDPATAHYDGMPRSAIAAGVVDMVLSPEGIAAGTRPLGRSSLLRRARATSRGRGRGAAIRHYLRHL